MRLILEYTEGDGCTYSCTNTYPVEYSDAESLLNDFRVAATEAMKKGDPFSFLGREFWPSHFFEKASDGFVQRNPEAPVLRQHGELYMEVMPRVMTLDEYFVDAMRA